MRNLKKMQIKEGAEEVLEALIKLANFKGFFRKFMLLFIFFLFFSSATPGGSIKVQIQASAATLAPETEQQIYVKSVRSKMESQLITEVE